MRHKIRPLVTVIENGEIKLPLPLNTHLVRSRLIRAGISGLGDAVREFRGRIYARGLVGIIATQDVQVQILPKAGIADDAIASGLLLHRMLAFDHRVKSDIRAGSDNLGSKTTFDAIIEIIARRVMSGLNIGVPRRYYPSSEEMQTIRGRLDLQHLARRAFSAEVKVLVHYVPLQERNSLSELIKAVLLFLKAQARSPTTRRLIESCLTLLHQIPDRRLDRSWVAQVKTTPFEHQWEWLVDMANTFVESKGPSPVMAGEIDGFSILFSLHNLFERALKDRLTEATSSLDFTVRKNRSIGHLLVNQADLLPATRLEPDFTFETGGKIILIGDAKWKVSDKHFQREDAFQMISYMAHASVNSGAIFHPDRAVETCELDTFKVSDSTKYIYRIRISPDSLFSKDGMTVSKLLEQLKMAFQTILAPSTIVTS